MSYEGLNEKEKSMVDDVVQASLEDTPLFAPSVTAGSSNITLYADALIHYTTPGTNA